MARAWAGPPVLKLPTAQALLADQARTAFSWLLVPGLGLATRAHLVPFQRRMRVLLPAGGAEELPPAPALPADGAAQGARPARAPGPGPGPRRRAGRGPVRGEAREAAGADKP